MRLLEKHVSRQRILAFCAALLACSPSLGSRVSAQQADELARRATWDLPAPSQVREEVLQLMSALELEPAAAKAVQALWPETLDLPQGVELLQHLGATVALYEEEAAELMRLCQSTPASGRGPTFDFLTREETPPLVKNNLRLLYARWLAQNELHDEAAQVLAGLDTEAVIDPATLLFYQCVVNHALLKKEACLAAADKLLENASQIPRRYEAVAELVAADIRPLETDSLDEIARLMGDVRRRLHLHRAGKRVQNQEDEVIAKLDKLIEEMEKQSEDVSMASQSGGQPSSPAEESRALGGRGPGDVDQKRVGNEMDWGDLPPKEREEALQQIGKELPAHFREIIEEYFRKLAQDGADS
jgi:hypothetical protein